MTNSNLFAQSAFESYFLWLGDAPAKVTADWNPNKAEMQGVAHDDDNWYFTNTRYNIDFDAQFDWPPLDAPKIDYDGHLWKIPASVPLGQNLFNIPGVEHVSMSSTSELNDASYEHFGDPDFYQFGNIGYVVVPLTGGKSGKPAIAFFRTNPLTYINYAYLDKSIQGGDNAGWCSVEKKTGDIITSNDNTTRFERYKVDWGSIDSPSHNHDFITWDSFYQIHGLLGNVTLLEDMQGGEFSPSGEYFYVSCGTGGCLGNGHGRHPSDGIWVFSTSTWKALSRSTNSIFDNPGYFNYPFENNCNTCYNYTGYSGEFVWHPEGLTVWDNPNIKGQLHVITNRFAGYSLCDDEFSLHHYTNKIIANASDNGLSQTWYPPLPGSVDNPFVEFPDAINYYPIWDGAHIILRQGNYPTGGITLNKRLLITSEGGAATIK